MKIDFVKLIFSVYFFVISNQVSAALFQRDFLNVGDRLITYDDQSGLEWLDVATTTAHSYAEIASGYGGYTTNYGFEFATESQATSLLSSAGITYGFHYPGIGQGQLVWDTLNLLGVENSFFHSSFNGIIHASHGYLKNTNGGNTDMLYLAAVLETDLSDARIFANNGLAENVIIGNVGAFLVRQAQASNVPEPVSVALIGLGFACMRLISSFPRSGAHRPGGGGVSGGGQRLTTI